MRYIPYMSVSRVIVVDPGYHEETSYWAWELSVGGAEARILFFIFLFFYFLGVGLTLFLKSLRSYSIIKGHG